MGYAGRLDLPFRLRTQYAWGVIDLVAGSQLGGGGPTANHAYILRRLIIGVGTDKYL